MNIFMLEFCISLPSASSFCERKRWMYILSYLICFFREIKKIRKQKCGTNRTKMLKEIKCKVSEFVCYFFFFLTRRIQN